MSEIAVDPLKEDRLVIDVCLELGVPFFRHAPGTLLISWKGAVRVINRLESLGVEILSMEGSELDGEAVHPRIDLIYTSSAGRPEGPGEVAALWGDHVWIDLGIRVPQDPHR